MTPRALLDVAVDAAREAGAVLMQRFHQARTIELKGEGRINLVTDADQASEAVLLAALARHCPGHRVVAEERGIVGPRADFTWFVDPLDGTTNYAHQLPFFCVTLGVEGPAEDGRTRLLAGVVYDPTRDECFSAARGQGAFLNGVRLAVSGCASLERALLCTGFPYDVHQHPQAPLALFSRLVTRAQGMRRLGSAALDLAYVAAGRLDGFYELGLKPWDLAGAALLVQEAGGVMTRIDGAPLDVRVGDVLAAPPSLAPALTAECVAALRDVAWQPRAFQGE